MANIPAGFEPHFRKSPLTDAWEPLYSKREPESVTLGFVAGEQHSNSRGFVHGGLLTALADNAMGLSCGIQLEDAGLVSLSLRSGISGYQSGQINLFCAELRLRRWKSRGSSQRHFRCSFLKTCYF